MSDGGTDRLDFFVSYTQADQAWAEWIAWQLEEAGYRVLIQAWDFRGGDNWAAKVQEGVERADRTIAVLSPAYHDSTVGTVEWLAAWLPDPLGKNRRLLVARVVEVERRGILGQLQSFDLFGLAEKTARERLLAEVGLAVKGGRAKPSQPPRFPDGETHTGVNTAPNDHQPAFPGVVAVATADGEMLDRGRQRDDLRAALTGKSGQIVIVSGAVGVGKSMLVNKVVGDLQKAGHLHAVYREALASVPLDVRTLTEAMAARGSATVDEAWRGESSVARFEAALGAARDRPLVIVIEQAENLLEPSNRHLRDLDLDEAFEILATDGRHRVSIVLVTRAWPEASSRSLWLSKAHLIPVRDLPVAQLIEYVARLDGRRSTGILDLPREELESFFQALSCNPGNVSLAHTVIGLADIGMDAAELAANLTQQQARDVPRYLAGLLVEDLPNARQQVLNALVAFGIPVDSTAVTALLANITEPKIKLALDNLVEDGVLRISDTRYYLPWPEVEEIIRDRLKITRSDMWYRAADVLRHRRVDSPKNLDDLSVHFAMLKALLCAKFFAAAHRAIQEIDDILRGWNRAYLLFDQRREIRGKLDDARLEMENEVALGHIYQFRRDFEAAGRAYHEALTQAAHPKHRNNQVRIRVDLGSMYFMRHDIKEAAKCYLEARDDARRGGWPIVAMLASEGLADCLRHRGQYDQAIAHLEDALSSWALVPTGTRDGRIGARRAALCTLKLARWHGELGRLDIAERRLRDAHMIIREHDIQALNGAYLDGQADLHILVGEIPRARRLATAAVNEALRMNDPVALLQARTTSCITHLMEGEYRTALADIRQAHRYRLAEQSLIVLGLLAVAERRLGAKRESSQHFRTLFKEADTRCMRDGEDFSAREFRGLAICGLNLDGPFDLDVHNAVEDFRAARSMTRPATPGLAGRLEFLLKQIDDKAIRPGQLAPAIHVCGG